MITTLGPFYQFSSPYGHATLERDEWFVYRKLNPEEQKTEIQKILGSKSLGRIIRFRRNKRRYVIDQLYPSQDFTSLKKAIQFLIDNEDQLVFCS